jgi:hypothetical protein
LSEGRLTVRWLSVWWLSVWWLALRGLSIGGLRRLWRSGHLLLRWRRLWLKRRRGRLLWLPVWLLGRSWRPFSRAARLGHFVRLLPEHVAARLHLGKINLRRRRGLLYARDEHDGAARAELRACPGLNFRWLRDAPPVQESAKARIGVHEQAAPVLKPELCVAA